VATETCISPTNLLDTVSASSAPCEANIGAFNSTNSATSNGDFDDFRGSLRLHAGSGTQALLSRNEGLLADDGILARFLKACDGDVASAVDKLVQHLHWRGEYGTDSILEEQEDFADLERVSQR
jgi:hypothetical protein